MNQHVSTDAFVHEVSCTYRGETYLVRDNGAILRRTRPGKRPRPLDETWTFGTPCKSTGYMAVAGAKVHRIVATAFHGDAPSKGYVVDHSDTNRRNNRPENLRWVTRLENVLLNPITAKRIAHLYGSIEAFLDDPRNPKNGIVSPDFEWMRAVTPEESKASLDRMTSWAHADRATLPGPPAGIGEWIYQRGDLSDAVQAPDTSASKRPTRHPERELVPSHTGGAWQRFWRVPASFPLCPKPSTPDALAVYADRLVVGTVAVSSAFGETIVDRLTIALDRSKIWLLGSNPENEIKPWSVASITLESVDGRKIVHESHGMFFTRDGAEQTFVELQGLEWKGEDSIDNYC